MKGEGADVEGLLKCYTKMVTNCGNKEKKNNFKPGSDMIKLCVIKIIPRAKMDGNG